MSALVFFESSSELAVLTNTFTVNGTPTDPSTVTLVVTDPEGTDTSYTGGDVTNSATGVYTKNIACTIAGEWTFRWVGTGAVTDTEVGTWTVFDVTLGRLYGTVAALKSRLGIDHIRDDYELHTACFAASRMAEHYTQRFFYRAVDTVATFTPCEPYVLTLAQDDVWVGDLVEVTTLTVDGAAWVEDTDYQLQPVNAATGPEPRPYTKVQALGRTWPLSFSPTARNDLVEITGTFGWPKLPYAVKQSVLITATELFKSKSTFEAQMGYEEMAQLIVRRNPMALDLIKPYRRHALLVA